MKEIDGFDGKYYLTDTQDVYSKKTNKILSKHINQGYYTVGLWYNGKTVHLRIHNIVAKAYPEICGEWFEGCHVHHVDHNNLNNDPHNLIILTPEDHKKYHSESEITQKYLSVSHKGQRAWNKGKHTKSGMEGKHHTEKSKRKMRENSTVKKPVIQLSLDGMVIKQFESTIEAERELGINHSNISRCCDNKPHYNTAGGFKWKYLN